MAIGVQLLALDEPEVRPIRPTPLPSVSDLEHYHGLVVSTAALVVGKVELEFDDIVQILWIKVWRAVERHEPARSAVTQDEFVFGCLMNQVKDLKKRPRRRTVGFDDLGFQSQDRLEKSLGLTVDQEVVYGEAEEEEMILPNTLTVEERGLIELLTSGYRAAEAARALGWTPAVVARTMRKIREKLADWAPSTPSEPAACESSSTPLPLERAAVSHPSRTPDSMAA